MVLHAVEVELFSLDVWSFSYVCGPVTTHHSLSCEKIMNSDLNNETNSAGSQSWGVLNHLRCLRREVSQIEFKKQSMQMQAHIVFFCLFQFSSRMSFRLFWVLYECRERINHSVSCGKGKKDMLVPLRGSHRGPSVHGAVFYLAFEVKEIYEETLWH